MAFQSRSYRRSRFLVCYWQDGLVIENYVKRIATQISSPVLALVDGIAECATETWILHGLGGDSTAQKLLDMLISRAIIMEVGSEEDLGETRIDDAWRWGRPALAFHRSASDARFIANLDLQREELLAKATIEPPPPAVKHVPGPKLRWDMGPDESGPFWQVLRRRRTCRSFALVPVSVEQLLCVLKWTWGATRVVDAGPLGEYLKKTSPSGGARHPIEVYVLVNRVSGLEPGVYHYCAVSFTLTRICGRPGDEEIVALCGGQVWVGGAAAICLMSAVSDRVAWKYEHATAYRTLFIDAGHLGQTFQLVCTEVGLGSFVTAAIDTERICTLLALEDPSEFPVYACGLGLARE
jgi:SagB-type dehydrogenase family enzyme